MGNSIIRVLISMGTRPEAIKLASVVQAMVSSNIFHPVICISSQHKQMLNNVLETFKISPDYDLNIMTKNQSLHSMTSKILLTMQSVIKQANPDLLLVQGDTTTAMVSALAAYYMGIPIGHVEAGLRTGDKYRPFPEEINRSFIDILADLHFPPTEAARSNLIDRRLASYDISAVGNTGIDSLLAVSKILSSIDPESKRHRPLLEGIPRSLVTYLVKPNRRRLILVTGHRRESFGRDLENICAALVQIITNNPEVEIVYPVHLNPNVEGTVNRILGKSPRIHLLQPLSYTAFVWLMKQAYLILTDSGGVQEEAPSLGVPTLVMRQITERLEGIESGSAFVVGVDTDTIVQYTQQLLDDPAKHGAMSVIKNLYGDGHSSSRILSIISDWYNARV